MSEHHKSYVMEQFKRMLNNGYIYEKEELARIVQIAAIKLQKECSSDGALEIAKRSRGTPRIALRLLKRVRDFAEVAEEGIITKERTQYALNELGVNEYGFDELSALLMLDDIEKAQEKQDKEKLNDLLAFLVRGKHEVRTRVSQELLEQIKKNNPEVWEEYQKLCANSAKREKELEEGYSKIIETEL